MEIQPKDFKLVPCDICGRKFREDVWPRHTPICAKSQKKKRKVFDSGKMRATNSDIPLSKALKPGEIPKDDHRDIIAKQRLANWREKREQFINNIRSAKVYTQAKQSGGPLPPPVPAAVDPSLVQCPVCSRRFNETAAARHIPSCRERNSRGVGGAVASNNPARPAPASKPTTSKSGGDPPASKGRGVASASSTAPKVGITGSSRPGPTSSNSKSAVPSSTVGPPGRKATPGISAVGNRGVAPRGPSGDHSVPAGSSTAAGVSRLRQPNPSSSSRVAPTAAGIRPNTTASGGTGFCQGCGVKFASSVAKFCAGCGAKRIS